jgi:hypothetical protein
MTFHTLQSVNAGTFSRYARRVERKETAKHGRSLTATTISSNSSLIKYGARIEEIHGETLLITGDWRKAIREAALLDSTN